MYQRTDEKFVLNFTGQLTINFVLNCLKVSSKNSKHFKEKKQIPMFPFILSYIIFMKVSYLH